MNEFYKFLYYFLWIHLSVSIIEGFIFTYRIVIGYKYKNKKRQASFEEIRKLFFNLSNMLNQPIACILLHIIVVFHNFIRFGYAQSLFKIDTPEN